jgi:hypothetical protein
MAFVKSNVIGDVMAEEKKWDTKQLQEDFIVHSFLAPVVIVTRKVDGVKGTLEFDHHPRWYYNFIPESGS